MNTTNLINRGLVVLPLKPGTKIPLLPWAGLQQRRPSFSLIKQIAEIPAKEWGIVNGPASGVYCLDYDAPPYPEGLEYTETPSGGRHYYFKWKPDYGFSIRIQPNLDIPHISKIYGPVIINDCPPPVTAPKRIPVHNLETSKLSTDNVPSRFFSECEFIAWFQQRRNEPNFENRYPVARAYASNIIHADNPDTSLGPGYQHYQDIYDRIGRPTTCKTIVRHWECPMWDGSQCTKKQGVTSPYGLALKLSRAKQQP